MSKYTGLATSLTASQFPFKLPQFNAFPSTKAQLSNFDEAKMIDEIVGGLDVAQRWGVAEGQLSLASKMINSQAINRVVRQYIDGEIDAAGAIAAMNDELSGIE